MPHVNIYLFLDTMGGEKGGYTKKMSGGVDK